LRPDDPSRLLRATFRSARFVVGYQAAGLLAIALSSLPASRPLFNAGVEVVGKAVGAILLTNLAATWAFHSGGEKSRRYRSLALLEIVLYQFALMWVIYEGGSGASFMWIFWLGQAAVNGGITEHHRAMLLAYTVPPLLLAAAFLLGRGDGTGAVASVLGAAVGFLIFSAGLRVNLRLAQAIADREVALAELAELQIRDERVRIARDLHDGVAADLVAVAMRADWARIAPDDLREQELREIAGRTREAIDDLRSVVWSMRAPARSPSDLIAYVEQRCRELCGRAVALDLEATASTRRDIPGACALELVRVAQECCRNAVRHGSPSRLSVRLALDDLITLSVEDDGAGLPPGTELRPEGGLANLRARAAQRGGSVAVHRLAQGTRIEVSFKADG